ncbi:MAG TPA: FHA domain-containing protein, partial [Candidatus Saccharimonadales bacterium]|nr:FHA domain-containing protein [Candidatus Saccharimonadales bacterium]
LRHPSIAARHAQIQWRKQGYVLTDLQSATGTHINGRRVTENLLKNGWTVRFGEVEFVFYEATSRH